MPDIQKLSYDAIRRLFRATFRGDGGQDFPDYEEGDFTPDRAFTTSNGNSTGTNKTGHFLRKGRDVSFVARVDITKGTAAGGVAIIGMPFANGSFDWPCSVYFDGFAPPASTQVIGKINPGTSEVDLYKCGSTTALLNATDLGGGLNIIIVAGVYQIP